MSKFNFEVDTKEYGFIDIKPKAYSFRAICTSDSCRLRHSDTEQRTDIGVIKSVSKKVDTCPDCKYYLFWDKVEAA